MAVKEKVRDLERQLAQYENDNKHRSAKLNERDAILVERERQLETHQQELAIAQKSVQAREERLLMMSACRPPTLWLNGLNRIQNSSSIVQL